ncbi:hypothetical protein BKI52_28575 [marine bacterium AO1-C]|nr:hypothetical protein BKI52_28575 [marine bacterium AO1-C]
MILLVKGRRKSWKFILQIATGILLAIFALLMFTGINWWLAILISMGCTLPFLVVLATLFLRVLEPDRYFIFDKAWNTFQCKLNAANDSGKVVLELPLNALVKVEGNYDSKSNIEEMILNFNLDNQEEKQILLLRQSGENSTLSDREHLRLFL